MTHAPDPRPEPVRGPSAVETAWRIHTGVAEWTGRVDVKASVLLTLEMAVLVGLVTLTTSSRGAPNGALAGPLWAGALFVAAGVICAVLVVMPRMRGRRMAAEAADNFIYFGHLRLWDPVRLAEAFHRDALDVLARDVVVNSGIAWRKHRLLQLSIAFALAGVLLLLLALLLGSGAARPSA